MMHSDNLSFILAVNYPLYLMGFLFCMHAVDAHTKTNSDKVVL